MSDPGQPREQASSIKLSPDTIGVAISGGGVRAAFFALGALMYLVHSGLHHRVRLISSVSGGSIVNVAIALAGDYSSAEPVTFVRTAARISNHMAKKGVFFWPGLRRLALSVFVFSLWSPVFLSAMILFGVMEGWSWDDFWLGELLFTGPMLLYTLLFLLFGRARIQQAAYKQFFRVVLMPRHGRRRGNKLSDLPESVVSHVLCATELTSGQPFYMSRDMVLSPLYGRGRPDVLVHRAVYASAAFPIGFPPLRLRAAPLRMTDGQDDDQPPRLFLSDGGVFNNLGTETFSVDQPAQIFLPDPTLPIIPAVDLQLVVNASSPPRKDTLTTMPVRSTITIIARIITVMYENTLRPRVQRLKQDEAVAGGPVVVDIADSPIELVDRICQGRDERDAVRVRALRTRETLGRDRSDHGWKVYADKGARTKTVLSAVGKTAGVRLVRLGYLDTAIACNARLGTRGVDSVPDEAWFQDFVDDNLTEAQLGAPVGHQVAG